MYCPRCSTPLAKAEVAMDNSYKSVKEDTIIVKFKLADREGYALAWTTTPWTLPSNLALSVNPRLKYAFIKDKKDLNVYLFAKNLIGNFYKKSEDYEILEEISGDKLEGMRFEPLFDYFKNTPNAFKFLLGDFVTEEEGTGIVHTAPAFGEDDYQICKKYNILLVQPIDEKGRFTKEVKDFEGKYIHDADKEIINFLKKQNKIVLVKKMEHEYPFCYRCETKLMYRAIPAWFVDIQKIKPKVLELNQKLNWYPDFLKDGRAQHTIETAPDWNISRNRYWAAAMPVWKSEDGEKLVIGSIEELKRYARNLKSNEINLHKDFLDGLILFKDGKEYQRIPEVLDCWFESGSMTFAQFHYPFENKEFFEKNFPAQFVAEYIGQVRAWFYYMLVLSAILFDDIPFENIVTTGTILAQDGQKMSKSKNNFTDPMVLVEKYGADALRFSLISSSVMNAENYNFSDKVVDDIYKKIIVLLYNVNNFYGLYPNLKIKENIESNNFLDKWMISRLNELNLNVGKFLSEYNTIKACEEIRIFVDDLSTWYVRRSRERFNEGDTEAKTVLREVLGTTSKIIAPIMPFIAEIIYKNVFGRTSSVHLEDWPNADEKKISLQINKNMQKVREIVSLALKERDKSKVSLKQPLASLTIEGYELDEKYLGLIREEVNIKKVNVKKSESVKIYLDLVINSELEAEGFIRELARHIQAERKQLGLQKGDFVDIQIDCDLSVEKIIKGWETLLKERINARKLNFVEYKKENNFKEFLIKEKKIKVHIIK